MDALCSPPSGVIINLVRQNTPLENTRRDGTSSERAALINGPMNVKRERAHLFAYTQ